MDDPFNPHWFGSRYGLIAKSNHSATKDSKTLLKNGVFDIFLSWSSLTGLSTLGIGTCY